MRSFPASSMLNRPNTPGCLRSSGWVQTSADASRRTTVSCTVSAAAGDNLIRLVFRAWKPLAQLVSEVLPSGPSIVGFSKPRCRAGSPILARQAPRCRGRSSRRSLSAHRPQARCLHASCRPLSLEPHAEAPADVRLRSPSSTEDASFREHEGAGPVCQ